MAVEGTQSIFKKTWILMMWHVNVSFLVSAEYINLIVISNLIWPGEPPHMLEMGAMITFRLWVDGLMALLWGFLVDRLPRKTLFSINATVTGGLVFLNATLPVGGGINHYLIWLFTRMCIGAFMSGGGPNIQSLSNDLLQSNQRSQFFGNMAIAWNGLQVAGMILSAFLFSLGFWRFFYIISGSLFIIQGMLLLFWFKEPKRASGHESFKQLFGEMDVNYKYKLNKDTIKETIFSKTNMLVFVEGIFTSILFGIIDLISLPYIQSEPRNISPFASSIFMLIFGVPGVLVGSLLFAKVSDKFGAKNLKNRIYLIIFSLLSAMIMIFIAFSLPLPTFSIEEGANIPFLMGVVFSNGIFLLFGIVMFFMRSLFSIYATNQPPIIQEINLPEAQGQIASWNQLVEIFSYGAGPLLAGSVLSFLNNDYQLSIQIISLIALPGITMWFLALRWIENDKNRIKKILETRVKEMRSANKLKKTLDSNPTYPTKRT